jgi:hypothetical protein
MPRKYATGNPEPESPVVASTQRDGVQPAVTTRWEASLVAAQGPEHVYSVAATYRIGDILLHEQFGKGVVLKLSTRKCIVLFKDKERLMASAN